MGITSMQALSELQRDALREVANIGAAHAATALSLMTGTRIMISVPTITVTPLAKLAPLIAHADEHIAVAVCADGLVFVHCASLSLSRVSGEGNSRLRARAG